MKPDKKTRADAVLKNLPEPRQAEIYERLTVKTPDWPNTSYAAVLAWLKADGLETSSGALHSFYSAYTFRKQLGANASVVETLLADFKSANPTATPEQIQSTGQAFFSALALQQQDPQQWRWIQQSQLQQQQLALERKKFQRDTCELFVKWQADKRAAEIAGSPSSNAEKIEQLGALMFGEDWK